jgi:hypothetical protein
MALNGSFHIDLLTCNGYIKHIGQFAQSTEESVSYFVIKYVIFLPPIAKQSKY